jgi:lipid A 3-O-deacylase
LAYCSSAYPSHNLLNVITTSPICFSILLAGFIISIGAPSLAAHQWFVPEQPLLNLQAGAFQVCDSDPVFLAGLEYRPDARFLHISPWLLFNYGEHGETYTALGALLDLHLGFNWFLTPHFGAGYYDDAGCFELGSKIEFRSTLELSRRFSNEHRLGLGFGHMSNGPLSDRNPGTEVLYLTYGFPFK